MREVYGQSDELLVILHGGAGPMDPSADGVATATAALIRIAKAVVAAANSGPIDQAVLKGLEELELDPLFNAGRGSALQSDGEIRLTAAVMGSAKETFSGVMSVGSMLHPSRLALALQNRPSRVLTNPGAQLLADELGEGPAELEIELRREQFKRGKSGERDELANYGCDTVGCIVRLPSGEMFCGTSTGGRGLEFPGRLSDSATVAGTFCSPFAAISATGVGEQIVDDALAARLETRCRDGASLAEASQRCTQEALAKQREYGWIALDQHGAWGASHLTEAMPFVVMSGSETILMSS